MSFFPANSFFLGRFFSETSNKNLTTEEGGSTHNIELMPEKPEWMLLISLEDTIVFPYTVTYLTVRSNSLAQFLRKAYEENLLFAIAVAKDKKKSSQLENFHPIGVVAKVSKLVAFHDEQVVAVIQGKQRCELLEVELNAKELRAYVQLKPEEVIDNSLPKVRALSTSMREITLKILDLQSETATDVRSVLTNPKIEDLVFLTYFISFHIGDFNQNTIGKFCICSRKKKSWRNFLMMVFMKKHVTLL